MTRRFRSFEAFAADDAPAPQDLHRGELRTYGQLRTASDAGSFGTGWRGRHDHPRFALSLVRDTRELVLVKGGNGGHTDEPLFGLERPIWPDGAVEIIGNCEVADDGDGEPWTAFARIALVGWEEWAERAYGLRWLRERLLIHNLINEEDR